MTSRNLPVRRAARPEMTITGGRLWHVPAVFLMLYVGAREGYFSGRLVEARAQVPLLWSVLTVTLFGCAWLGGGFVKRARLRITTIDDDVVGHTILIRHASSMEIATFAVHPGFRRRGIGTRMLEDVVELAGDLVVDAACQPRSHGMRMLLKNNGFVEKGRFQAEPSAHAGLRHWQFSPLNLAA